MPGELEEKFNDGAWYDVRIEDIRCDESSGGTPGIMIQWMVTDGEMTGKYLSDDHWISENNKKSQRETFLKVFAYDIATQDLDQIGKLVGQEATIKIKYETWKGESRPKVGRIRKKGAGSSLSPAKRIASFFGTVEEDSGEDSDKDFDFGENVEKDKKKAKK